MKTFIEDILEMTPNEFEGLVGDAYDTSVTIKVTEDGGWQLYQPNTDDGFADNESEWDLVITAHRQPQAELWRHISYVTLATCATILAEQTNATLPMMASGSLDALFRFPYARVYCGIAPDGLCQKKTLDESREQWVAEGYPDLIDFAASRNRPQRSKHDPQQ